MNYEAVDKGIEELKEIKYPESWKDLKDDVVEKKETTKFFEEVAEVMNAQKGDSLPVSKFIGIEDGTFENGTAKFEKRAIAVNLPKWHKENCIQCNPVSYTHLTLPTTPYV